MINDYKNFKHGEEGTHGACTEMVEKYGEKVRCCGCTGHKCKDSAPASQPIKKCTNDDHCSVHPLRSTPPIQKCTCQKLKDFSGDTWLAVNKACPLHGTPPVQECDNCKQSTSGRCTSHPVTNDEITDYLSRKNYPITPPVVSGDKVCICGCHDKKYSEALYEAKMKPIGCMHCKPPITSSPVKDELDNEKLSNLTGEKVDNPGSVSGWEERFDEEFMSQGELLIRCDGPEDAEDIKAFIKAELTQQKQQIREWTKNKRKHTDRISRKQLHTNNGYNHALDDILRLLED